MAGLDLLERFRRLATEFHEAAVRGDLPAMDALLSERRALLRRFGPPEDGGAENGGRRELLEAILELDRKSERALESRRDDLGAQLLALDEGRRGLAGYGGGPRTRSRIDERR